jgi:hypothetical protein
MRADSASRIRDDQSQGKNRALGYFSARAGSAVSYCATVLGASLLAGGAVSLLAHTIITQGDGSITPAIFAGGVMGAAVMGAGLAGMNFFNHLAARVIAQPDMVNDGHTPDWNFLLDNIRRARGGISGTESHAGHLPGNVDIWVVRRAGDLIPEIMTAHDFSEFRRAADASSVPLVMVEPGVDQDGHPLITVRRTVAGKLHGDEPGEPAMATVSGKRVTAARYFSQGKDVTENIAAALQEAGSRNCAAY